MQLNQDGVCDPADEEAGARLRSREMIQIISICLKGIVIVAGMTVIPASALSGGERPHPSLVDPAITKCTVCHTSLGAAHTVGALNEDCLTCHTFVDKSEKTFLVVEDSQPSRDAEDLQEPAETAGAGIQPEDHGTSAPSVETVAVIAEENSTPSGTDLPPASGDAASTGQLYAEGMAAFNRADFERAFDTWWLMLSSRSEYWVIQVEMDTYLVSAQTTLASYEEHSLYVIKKDGYHWVLSGLFATRAKATEALELLPASLRKGGAFPIAVREIMPQH